VVITVGTRTDHYLLGEAGHQDTFTLAKLGTGLVYQVRLGAAGTCTCPGHRYRGRCKHLAALTALAAAGGLDS
jgi:hypothetical protein